MAEREKCQAFSRCLAPDTKIYTADGVKRLKDLSAGDRVLTQSGRYLEVIRHALHGEVGPMREIHVEHAFEPLRLTVKHPILVMRGGATGILADSEDKTVPVGAAASAWGGAEWMAAEEIQPGDYVAQAIPRGEHAIGEFTDDDARFYGVLLASGHLSRDDRQWCITGETGDVGYMRFVRDYLQFHGIYYRIASRSACMAQILWNATVNMVREGSSNGYLGVEESLLPFLVDDLYNERGEKRISRRFSHLPKSQTLALIGGVLETGTETDAGHLCFSSHSQALIDSLRFQLLRLGIPSAGASRSGAPSTTYDRGGDPRYGIHTTGNRYELQIPAVPGFADRLGYEAVLKPTWLKHNGLLFSRVRECREMRPASFVFDLEVEGDEGYMTNAALTRTGTEGVGRPHARYPEIKEPQPLPDEFKAGGYH